MAKEGLRGGSPTLPVNVEETSIAGVRTDIITPLATPQPNQRKVLINAWRWIHRDLLLSDTVLYHLALVRSGNDAHLLVFEALPHAFWYHFQLPETKEALQAMANFFDKRVGR